VRDLAIKSTSYAHYLSSREGARERSVIPVLVCIVPDSAQESRVQRVAQARLVHPPAPVLWTTTVVLLNEYGPLAPIWLQGTLKRRQPTQPGSSLRQRWSEVISGKKDM